MKLNKQMYWCKINITDEIVIPNNKYKIYMEINQKPYTEHKILFIDKNASDDEKEKMILKIKNWFFNNHKSFSRTDSTGFLNLYEEDIRNSIRIHNWKNIVEIKKDKQINVNGINEFTTYIDNYKQQKQAEEDNRRLMVTIKLYNLVIKQMEDIIKKTNNNNVEYSFGTYRIKTNNGYEYQKFIR